MIKINSQSFSLPSTVRTVHNKGHQFNEDHQFRTNEIALRSTPKSFSKETWQLHYITERILSAIFPIINNGKIESNDEEKLLEMFNQKYGKNYRIFDLESCFSKVSLEKLCELCKQINLWLEISEKNVVILQDRGSYDRLAAAVETYLEYTKICVSTENRYLNNAIDMKDLDIYSMQKFLNDVTGMSVQPPFKRYIECFSALLCGKIKLNSSPITITHVIMQSPPYLNQMYPYDREWNTFMQVYENEQCVFVSDIYSMPQRTKEIFYEIKSPLTLFGEISINFYKLSQKPNKNTLLSSLQFHSCSVTGDQIEFPKNDLLFAHDDSKFPNDHKIILLLNTATLALRRSLSPVKSPQTYRTMDKYGGDYTHGPVNGSLYATVSRNQQQTQRSTSQTSERNITLPDSEQAELDTLLSEMLLTVQNMPDVNKTVHKENISPVNFNIDHNDKFMYKNIGNNKLTAATTTTHTLTLNNTQPTNIYSSDNVAYSKNKVDLSENVSVSTIESSRNSPLMYDLQSRQKQTNNNNAVYYNSDSEYYYDTDNTTSHNTKTNQYNYKNINDENNRENYILQNLDQSYTHMQSNNLTQNIDIPYHARKDSQPFTYGNINAVDGNMMRTTHSGLSSPSMVRKASSFRSDSSTSTLNNKKKPAVDIDFEEMLHERQEKKYSFGDRTPTNREFNSIYNKKVEYENKNNDNRFKTSSKKNNDDFDSYKFNLINSSNGNMDNSFDRSGYSSDCSYSGQTWLQIQQQKLRSRKAFQQNDFTDGETIRSRTLSPNGNFQTITTKTVTTSTRQPTAVRTKQVEYQYKPVRREDSYQLNRYESDLSRPPTPAFPPLTPTRNYGANSPSLPPKSPTLQRRELHLLNRQADFGTMDKWTTLQRTNSSVSSVSEPQEVDPNFVKFARDSSKYWYKPTLSREEAVKILRYAPPGSFLVRDSTSFNAFGLVVKVPPGSRGQNANSDELVRHFLIEPTVRGVRLKGCANEPVFSSLSALIYQHSITPLSLPCRLIIPEQDLQNHNDQLTPVQKQLFEQGAACNVLYLYSAETESLTGPEAIRRTVSMLHEKRRLPKPIQVHFKVSQQGITLTDNTRQLFFRKHYPANTITYIGLDPNESRWSVQTNKEIPVINYRIFAFIAKMSSASNDNQCHLFCELEENQPATAIVSFGNRVLLNGSKQSNVIASQI